VVAQALEAGGLKPGRPARYGALVLRPVALVALVLALAPMQCSRGQDPALAREESPGDALYALAQDFRSRGDEKAWRETLEFLVKRYPSSRRAVSARLDLDAGGRDGGT